MKDTFKHKGLRQQLVDTIKNKGIEDENVLYAIGDIPRHLFMDSGFLDHAYQDKAFPIAADQTISQPYTVAFQTQLLKVEKGDKVLEIGTGSGFLTALLAKLAKQVLSVEIFDDLSAQAAVKLEKHGIYNVTLEVGDAASGRGNDTAYDVIAITGSLPVLPENLKQSLKVGGRLFAIVGDDPVMEGILISRVSENEWSEESLQETNIASLVNAQQPQRFVF